MLPRIAKAVANYTMDFSSDAVLRWNGGRSVNCATEDDSGTGWSWTRANQTLTLNGLQFTTIASIAIKLPAGVTIALTTGSSNSVTLTFQGDASSIKVSRGICVGALMVFGGGSLTATAGSETGKLEASTGIEVDNGLTLFGGCTLTGIGQDAQYSYGVALTSPSGSTTVKDSAILTGRGGAGSLRAYSVFAGGGSITVDSGRIEGFSSSYIDGIGDCHITGLKCS